jgi:hypothetical protein
MKPKSISAAPSAIDSRTRQDTTTGCGDARTSGSASRFVAIGRPEAFERPEQPVELVFGEQVLGAAGGETGVGVLVDAAGFDHASFGQLVDDEVDELDLCAGVALVVEELGEGLLGGCSVETDERADEVAEVAGPLAGERERRVVADPGGDQDPLEVREVLRGERPAGPDLGDRIVGEVLGQEVLGLLRNCMNS